MTAVTVTVRLSEFVLQALGVKTGSGAGYAEAELARAVRVYVGDKGEDRPGWAYPPFFEEEGAGEVELELTVDEDLWRALEKEASEQGVTVSRMAAHAALYYAAELDAGRVTQRILDEIEGEGA